MEERRVCLEHLQAKGILPADATLQNAEDWACKHDWPQPYCGDCPYLPGSDHPDVRDDHTLPCATCGQPVPVHDEWEGPVWCLECYNDALGGEDP